MGNRVAIMTLGGGWGVITTDLCAENGIEVPELSQDIIKRLNKILPSFWSHGNPIDIVGENDTQVPKICLEELLKWHGCDAVIHLGIHGRRVVINPTIESAHKTDPGVDDAKAQALKDDFLDFEKEYIKDIVKLMQQYEKPIIGVSLLEDEISRNFYRFEEYKYSGVFFPSPERAVKAFWGMHRYSDWKASHPVAAI
jgi:acyl-CoA synthetase (NDP forming)